MIKDGNLPFFHTMGDHDNWEWEEFIDRTCMPPKCYYYLKKGILHIFLHNFGSQWSAGFYDMEMYYFIKYLVEHKYPDKTTAFYGHHGVFSYAPAWHQYDGSGIPGDPHWNKFANYQDTVFFNELFRNNPQIKLWFCGHTHRHIYYEDTWNLKNGVLFVGLENWSKGPATYTGNSSAGPTRDWPLVTIAKDYIHVVPYNAPFIGIV